MFTTQNQIDFIKALTILESLKGPTYTSGYLTSMASDMLNSLPKRKQKEFIKQIEQLNGKQMVEVTNLMTGEKVMQRRDTPRALDVSSELYWSM